MDLYLLRTFAAIAHERHLTRAAERLHISQPTASAHIRALEESLGVTLFLRRKQGLELTNAGQVLLAKAEDVLATAGELVSTARSLQAGIEGKLTLGSNADPTLSRVGELVAGMRTAHPLVHLSVELRHSAAILRGLRGADLDAGFFLGQAPEESLAHIVLKRLSYRIAGPVAWARELHAADWRALAKLPWIMTSPGNSHADMINALFRGRGLSLNRVVQADNDLVIRDMIRHGVGVSLVRDDHAGAAEAAGNLALSRLATAHTELLFAYPRVRSCEPVMQALCATLAQVWEITLPAPT